MGRDREGGKRRGARRKVRQMECVHGDGRMKEQQKMDLEDNQQLR